MGVITNLRNSICPPLDEGLSDLLIIEFASIEQRYAVQDWEPAMLDGGQFCEILARLIYFVDSGNLNRRKSVGSCLTYIEDHNNHNNHQFSQRRSLLHLCKVIRTIYKFRSQRGAVHIDPEYSANEIDSSMLIANVRWLMSETLRLFWNSNRSEVSKVIKEIVQYDVPSIINVDGKNIVINTNCSVEEEILLLLHISGSEGLNRNEIGRATPLASARISEALSRLKSKEKRQIYKKDNEKYIITANGSKRVHYEMGEKLLSTNV